MNKIKYEKSINLALQGGGAHGAFTWGVLDRLLEEEKLHINAISGTSAGAMNAIILVNGYMKDGAKGARKALEDFWGDISEMGNPLGSFDGGPLEPFLAPLRNLDWSLTCTAFDIMSRLLSPYTLNPLNLNPLRSLLEEHVNLDDIHACARTKLFIAATQVQTGHPRIFTGDEISIDAVLASACLPFLFQAVMVDGEPYWDGGYMGNPVIWPLIYHTKIQDILLVQINPLYSEGVPMKSAEIINRMNEINFNSSLIAEMRAINFVSKLIREHRLDTDKYRDVRMHMIQMVNKTDELSVYSKMNTRWDFFLLMKKAGRESASTWLKNHYHQIGKESTIDINKTFLQSPKKPKSA